MVMDMVCCHQLSVWMEGIVMTCPSCDMEHYQVRDGKTAAGSQRMRSQVCGKRYTPQPKTVGYDQATRQQALRLVADGINLRRTQRLLHVHHTTVLRWKRQAAARLPTIPPQPQIVDEIELDELYTFETRKKTVGI